MPSLREIGEQGLLKLLKPFCSDRMGDDGAVMGELAQGYEMVVTTDILIDGIHFSPQTTAPEDTGWRAAAANLSDLAAMGASPWGVTLALGLPADADINWILGVYRGFTACLKAYNTELVGGDTVRSLVKTLAVTAFGQVKSDQIIYRHTAQVGDLILITGEHGLSRAGLEILVNPELAQNLSIDAIAKLHQAHQRPQPRLDILPLSYRVSGMDSSDGLADAIAQICDASGVNAEIMQVPIPEEVKLVADQVGVAAIDWVLYGGEDFELVLCLAPDHAEKLVKSIPTAKIIGQIILKDQTQENSQRINLSKSFQHF
ncbi:thiamine-monophosphate kinase [Synechococcus sp. PCC 7502]|uniref:thiamine-phosphate kinase n=1 Tax=Synechococcus sp. PCC 7502 TaxID=1173263 RepID=UPI00029FB48A|nr:thiamine-phosphate kinase [Synechococcus sp. PCC 7502]AFY72307.1 thiamine-monophosphate kinase [Synechococcus sp. PCC 7502]